MHMRHVEETADVAISKSVIPTWVVPPPCKLFFLRGRLILLDLRIKYIKIWGGEWCEIMGNQNERLLKKGWESLI